MIFCDTVITSGWCEKIGPNKTTVEIQDRGLPIATVVEEIYRPDLANIYGIAAASWGFRARALLTSGAKDDNVEEGLVARIKAPGMDEVTLRSPSKQFVPDEDAEFYGVFTGFVKTVCARGGRVLEIGARARSGVSHRNLFSPLVRYVGLDISSGPNVDAVGDAHHLSRLVTGKFDAVFSISTFEHLLMPWKVALEINKVLELGGLAYTQSHQTWPLHDAPWDFWRFSQDSWHGLYNRHTGFEIIKAKHALPAFLSPALVYPGPDRGVCYLGSCCLARKIGEPEVAWEAEMDGIYDLAYDHGPTG
jgi:hypothetical protein